MGCVCTYIYIYTEREREEYYLATIKNKLMPFAATWIDLEIITLSEKEKNEYLMISVKCGL